MVNKIACSGKIKKECGNCCLEPFEFFVYSWFWKPVRSAGCYTQTWTPASTAERHQRRSEEPAASHADKSPAGPTEGQTLLPPVLQSSYVLWFPKSYDAWLKQVPSCVCVFFLSAILDMKIYLHTPKGNKATAGSIPAVTLSRQYILCSPNPHKDSFTRV